MGMNIVPCLITRLGLGGARFCLILAFACNKRGWRARRKICFHGYLGEVKQVP